MDTDCRYYETFFLIHPETNEDARSELHEKLKAIIKEHGGEVVKVDPWPLRQLAYKVQKQAKGFYVLMEYSAKGEAIEELTRNLRIDERVMKFITVKKGKDWSPDTSSLSE